MAFAYCPDCASRIYLGRKPWVGQLVMCDECEADLEVVRTNPPVLDWTENLPEDEWDREDQLALQSA